MQLWLIWVMIWTTCIYLITVRLDDETRTDTTVYGIPYVYDNGTFNTIDGVYFTKYDAHVVCTELGYNFSKVLPYGFYTYGRIPSPICIYKLNCAGTESNVYECEPSYANCSYRHTIVATVGCSTAFIDDSKYCYILVIYISY